MSLSHFYSCIRLLCAIKFFLLTYLIIYLLLRSLEEISAGRRERGRSPRRRLGAYAVGQPTLHGGPVVLRPVRVTPCLSINDLSPGQ